MSVRRAPALASTSVQNHIDSVRNNIRDRLLKCGNEHIHEDIRLDVINILRYEYVRKLTNLTLLPRFDRPLHNRFELLLFVRLFVLTAGRSRIVVHFCSYLS